LSDLLDLIKRAARDAVAAAGPVQVHVGSVVSADPLSVQVDQRFTLTAEFLLVPEQLIHYEVELRHTHGYLDVSESGTGPGQTEEALPTPVVIRRGLAVGDKLLLLRVQGGQQYVILDRVVSA
jgi:hypothetical protein